MRTRTFYSLAVALAVASILSSTSARADTIATFADPASSGDTPLFELADDILSGAWDDVGLNLITPITGEEFPDATFIMSGIAVDSDGMLSSGTIEFYESAAAGGGLILRIDFEAGQLFAPFGFGASDLEGHGVTFSGPIVSDPLVEEAFAFSFANEVSTQDGFTWTAAFTSSAIPEPTTLTLLALGGLALGTLRRRQS